MNIKAAKQGNPMLRALFLSAGIMVLGVLAFSMTACDFLGDFLNPGKPGTTDADKVTYTGTHNGDDYSLTITEKTTKATYTPRTDDSYALRIDGILSSGTVSLAETTGSNLKFTLKPAGSTTTFTVTVSPSERQITKVEGTVTFDNGQTKKGPGTLNNSNSATGSVTGVTLDLTELKLKEGGNTATLTATLTPSNPTNKNVTWTSSNPGVATVGTNGTLAKVIKAVDAGGTASTSSAHTTITVTTEDGSKTASYAVTVYSTNTEYLTGTVTITGDAVVGQELKAIITNLDTTSGTFSYQWNRGTGTVGSNSDKYTLASADTSHPITVTVKNSGLTGSVTSTPTAIVTAAGITNVVGEFTYIEESHWNDTDGTFLTITGYTGKNGSVEIPDKIGVIPVVSIERKAFSKKNLTSVTFKSPSYITNISDEAFSNNQLKSVIIPDSVKLISEEAFNNNQLESVTIGSNVTYIGGRAFYGNPSNGNKLTSVTIPDRVTSINYEAFSNNKLESVKIGNKVYSIGYKAFYGNKLTSVTIPASVYEISASAFMDNTSMTSLIFHTGSIVEYIYDEAFRNNKLTSVTIPASVKSIGDSAFMDNTSMTSLIFTAGSTLEYIEASAFRNNKLTSVTIPANVKSIGHSAFMNNTMTSLIFYTGSMVESIGDRAFRQNNLTSVTIPASVTEIGSGAFEYNPLTEVIINATNLTFYDNTFPDGESLLSAYNNGGHNGTYIYNTASTSWTKQP